MKKIIKLLLTVAVHFDLIKKFEYFIPVTEIKDPKNFAGYVYSFSTPLSKNALSGSYFIFANPTYAMLTLILMCSTYLSFDIRCYIVGYTDKDGNLYTFKNQQYLNYINIPLAYDDYKRNFGDSTDVPFDKLEQASIDLLYRFILNLNNSGLDGINHDRIKAIIAKNNITSYSNDELFEKISSKIDEFNKKEGVENNELHEQE